MGKVVVAIIVIVGVLLATAGSIAILTRHPVTAAYLEAILEYIREVILT